MSVTNQIGPFNYNLRSLSTPSNLQEFTATGTWVKPTNVTFVMVELWGGGGGGGSGAIGSTTSRITGGGGGGGGSYLQRLFKASELPATVVATVAAGGNPGTTTGGGGGTTTFGSFANAFGGTGGGGGVVDPSALIYPQCGTGGGGLSSGKPFISNTATTDNTAGHFGGNQYRGGADSGWGGGGGGGSIQQLNPQFGAVRGGSSVLGGAGGGMGGHLVATTPFAEQSQGGVGNADGNNPNNVRGPAGANGFNGTTARAGGNGGSAAWYTTTVANASGLDAIGARLLTGASATGYTSYSTADSGVTITNSFRAYDTGTVQIVSPIRNIAADPVGNKFYGFARGTTSKKIWVCDNTIGTLGIVWTLSFDFSSLISGSPTITNYSVQGGLHFATFSDGSLFVSTDASGTEFTLVGTGFVSGTTFVAYDATRTLWVIINSVNGGSIFTTTDFVTLTAIANLPATGVRDGFVITTAGRWIVSTRGTNVIRFTDNAGASAWTTPTSGLPSISGTPLLQIVNSLIVWSNGDAPLTLFSSADNGATFVAVAAPPTRITPEVAWDGTNYVVTLSGTASLAVFATSSTLTNTSSWTTRSATSPIITAGGFGGSGAAPGGGGGGGGASLSVTIGGIPLTTANTGGAGARGLIRVYAW